MYWALVASIVEPDEIVAQPIVVLRESKTLSDRQSRVRGMFPPSLPSPRSCGAEGCPVVFGVRLFAARVSSREEVLKEAVYQVETWAGARLAILFLVIVARTGAAWYWALC